MRIPSLAALRAFEAAARHRGFTPAAGELNVTPAAIAHHVRALEADLDVALVVRSGRGLAVTPAGRDLADGLSEGFATIARSIEALRDAEADRPLALAVTPAFASNWLMPRIGDFWQRHAEIPLSIQPGIELVDLKRDGVDLAIRYGDGDWPGLEAELLTDGQFWVVAHPDLLAGRAAACVADLADLPWLLEHYVIGRRDMIEGAGLSLDGVAIRPVGSNTLALSGAEAGLGVTVQPRSIVERSVRAGNLIKVCELRQDPLGYYLVTLPGARSGRVRTLIRWLRAQV